MLPGLPKNSSAHINIIIIMKYMSRFYSLDGKLVTKSGKFLFSLNSTLKKTSILCIRGCKFRISINMPSLTLLNTGRDDLSIFGNK